MGQGLAPPKPDQDSALARNDAAFEHLRTDMAHWKTAMVQRDTDNRRWIVGLFMAAIVNLVTLLGS